MAAEIMCCQMQCNDMGKSNLNYTYTQLGSELTVSSQERDCGVIVDTSLQKSDQCALVANKMLGIIIEEN